MDGCLVCDDLHLAAQQSKQRTTQPLLICRRRTHTHAREVTRPCKRRTYIRAGQTASSEVPSSVWTRSLPVKHAARTAPLHHTGRGGLQPGPLGASSPTTLCWSTGDGRRCAKAEEDGDIKYTERRCVQSEAQDHSVAWQTCRQRR